MTALTEHLWSQYTSAKLAALDNPSPANDARASEALIAFANAFGDATKDVAA